MEPKPVSKELQDLLEKAKDYVMSPKEKEAQRKSWVRGEMAMGTDADEERWKQEQLRAASSTTSELSPSAEMFIQKFDEEHKGKWSMPELLRAYARAASSLVATPPKDELTERIQELVEYRTLHGFPQSIHERNLIREQSIPDWAMALAAEIRGMAQVRLTCADLDLAEVLARRMSELGYYPLKTTIGIWTEIKAGASSPVPTKEKENG